MKNETSIYNKKYNYGQVKAICEVFKYRKDLQMKTNDEWTYEEIIEQAMQYYEEWRKLADLHNGKRKKPVYNAIGNEMELYDDEFAYEQDYFDRRIKEDYLY